MSDIILHDALSNERVLAPHPGAGTNTVSRIHLFVEWLNRTGRLWQTPDIAAYRDHLAGQHTPATVQAYLSTIRAHYRRLLADNDLRRALYDAAPGDDFANRRAYVEELYDRLRNEVDPINSRVSVPTKQDHADSESLRLTSEQAAQLMHAPGIETLNGLRDTVAIALMLTTGVRKFELCAIQVSHLRARFSGQLALLVPEGKGGKQRLVPYGAFEWVLPLTDKWLARAGIDDGPVLRGFYKGNEYIRKNALRPRSVRYLLDYPIVIDGELRVVEPHDLRRTYARLLYDAGMRPEVIQQNLGHASVQTTMGYIGEIDAERRKPPSGVLTFNLGNLG